MNPRYTMVKTTAPAAATTPWAFRCRLNVNRAATNTMIMPVEMMAMVVVASVPRVVSVRVGMLKLSTSPVIAARLFSQVRVAIP